MSSIYFVSLVWTRSAVPVYSTGPVLELCFCSCFEWVLQCILIDTWAQKVLFHTVLQIFLNTWKLWGKSIPPPQPLTKKCLCFTNTSKLLVEYGVFAGDYRVFRDDVVFWVTFSSVALMIPVLFVGCPRIVSHLSNYLGKRREGVSDYYAKCSPVGCV